MQSGAFERSPENTCMFASTLLWWVSQGTAFICRAEASGRRYVWHNTHAHTYHTHADVYTHMHLSHGWEIYAPRRAGHCSQEASTPFFGWVRRGGVIFRDCGTLNVPRSVFFPVGMASETTDQLDVTEHNPFSEIGPKCSLGPNSNNFRTTDFSPEAGKEEEP